MQEQIFHHKYGNGLTLVAQPMPWLESAAFSIAVPAGCRFDPDEKLGLANFVCEMVQRGAGPYNSREFIEVLESFGVDYTSSASLYNTNFGGAMQAAQLHDAIAVYADVLRRPKLPADQLEDGRLVCFQEIAALSDDLAQRALQQLRIKYYGATDGRNCEGTMETVGSITLEDIVQFYESNYRPNDLIIACAGKLDWESLKSHVGALFDDWAPKTPSTITPALAEHGVHHIAHESEQTHIAVAFPGVAYAHPDYYLNRGAIGVLSGGMSSRLFTEVREKRGLCYTVFASCHSLKDQGSVLSYAGTTNDRAQETLDVMVAELKKLAEGIQADELRRLKVQIRSGMVMQQESSRSRASSIAGDWFHLGAVRTLDEINDKISGLTVESINAYLAANPPRQFDVVTLGPQALEFTEPGLQQQGANHHGV